MPLSLRLNRLNLIYQVLLNSFSRNTQEFNGVKINQRRHCIVASIKLESINQTIIYEQE